MTRDKIQSVLDLYKIKLNELGIISVQHPHKIPTPPKNDVLAHCLTMIDQMEDFLKENRIEKVFRWLGFIQGCLWTCGVYTIEELKNHNRP